MMRTYRLQIENLPEAYLCFVGDYYINPYLIFKRGTELFKIPLSLYCIYRNDAYCNISELQNLFKCILDNKTEVEEVSSLSPAEIEEDRSSEIPDEYFPYIIPLLFSKKDIMKEDVMLIKNCFFNTPPKWLTFRKPSEKTHLETTPNFLLILYSTCRDLKNFDRILAKVTEVSPSNDIVIHKKSLEAMNHLKRRHPHLYKKFLECSKHSAAIHVFPLECDISKSEREILNEFLNSAVQQEKNHQELIFITERDKISLAETGRRYMNILNKETRENILKQLRKVKIESPEDVKFRLAERREREYLILPWIMQESESNRDALLKDYLKVYESSDGAKVVISSDMKNGIVFEEKEKYPSDFDRLIKRLAFWLTEIEKTVKSSHDKRALVSHLAELTLKPLKGKIQTATLVNALKNEKIPSGSLNLFATCLYVIASEDKAEYSEVIDTLKDHVLTRKSCIENCLNWIKHFESMKKKYKLVMPKSSLKKIPPAVLKRIAEIVMKHNVVEVEDKEEFIERLSVLSLVDQKVSPNLDNIKRLIQMTSRRSAVKYIASLTLESPLEDIKNRWTVKLENVIYNSFLVLKEAEKQGLDLKEIVNFICEVLKQISTLGESHYAYERYVKHCENEVSKDPVKLKNAVKIAKLIEKIQIGLSKAEKV